MAIISYENIDLFFYHSIDIDFARLSSILEYGILSKNEADKEHIKYYYRNYTHSSTRDDYISVNHFPRTILRYFQIENELYDFNTNKICFIIDDIIPLEKQACKNRFDYTNERHVEQKIDKSMIKGILLRERDAKKRLSEISFNYKFTDKAYFENKVFTTINFFINNFGSFGDVNKIYNLIGRLRESMIIGGDTDIILELIAREIKNKINEVFSKILGTDNPTLLEVVSYLNNSQYPIYVMNRFDIQLAGTELAKTDFRLEKFKEDSNITVSEMKNKKAMDKKVLKLLKKMSDSGLDIYYGYSIGPLNQEDFEISEKIKQLSLKK